MPKVKLTKTSIESVQPASKDTILWDTDLRGFGCAVRPSGKRTYFVYYRNSYGQQRRPMIGQHGCITCDEARRIAKQWLGEAANGKDPSAQKQSRRNATTVSELCDRYVKEYATPHKKPSSVAEDVRLITRKIKPWLGSKAVESIMRADIQRIHHRLHKTPYEANRLIALLSKIFNLSEAWGLRPDGSNPCRHVR